LTGSCDRVSDGEQIRIHFGLDKLPDICHNIDMKDKLSIPRARMSSSERQARSRLAQLMSGRGFMRGTLLVRRMKCGKANCKCARGERHESLFLVISENGRTRQLFVPKDWESRVRLWVEDYHRARELMEEISRIYWDKVRNRQD
jgi:hypothetical protein